MFYSRIWLLCFSLIIKVILVKQLEKIFTFDRRTAIGQVDAAFPILPPSSPLYDYALMSDAIYVDTLPSNHTLLKKGWRLEQFITDDVGYCGGIFIHEDRQQIIIAHRGSQNIASWLTDLESVLLLKPGNFVRSAIETLHHPIVKSHREKGFRLSTTGHSLGGFLAQVCVFWAQRSEFAETYYPDMSAIVFDSPGALDFLKVLHSNLVREKGRIILEHLNIHNFCAMPTLVSIFGAQTGTVWHLASTEKPVLAFINAHRFPSILSGFNSTTGKPLSFRQMRDWPQVDYRTINVNYLITSKLIEDIKQPLRFLTALYQAMKSYAGYVPSNPWYDGLLEKEKSQLEHFLQETPITGALHYPELQASLGKTNLALHAHYAAINDETTIRTMNIYHFDLVTQIFLQDLDGFRPWPENFASVLTTQYGEERTLLESFTIVSQGSIKEVRLTDHYQKTVLEFQEELQQLIYKNGTISIQQFKIENDQALKNQIDDLEKQLFELKENPKPKLKIQENIIRLEKERKIIYPQPVLEDSVRRNNFCDNVLTYQENSPKNTVVNSVTKKWVDQLKSKYVNERGYAAGMLANLASSKDNPYRKNSHLENKENIRNEGGIEILVELLNDTNLVVRQNAAAAIASLTGDKNRANQKLIYCKNGIENLVELLEDASDDNKFLQEYITTALMNFSENSDRYRDAILKTGITKRLLNLTAARDREEVQCKAAGVLVNIARSKDGRKIILDLNAAPNLLSVLKFESIKLQKQELLINLINIFGNLTEDLDYLPANLDPRLIAILAKLLVKGNIGIKLAVVNTLKNIADCLNEEVQNIIREAGLIVNLIRESLNGPLELQQNVNSVLWRLEYENIENQKAVSNAKAQFNTVSKLQSSSFSFFPRTNTNITEVAHMVPFAPEL